MIFVFFLFPDCSRICDWTYVRRRRRRHSVSVKAMANSILFVDVVYRCNHPTLYITALLSQLSTLGSATSGHLLVLRLILISCLPSYGILLTVFDK